MINGSPNQFGSTYSALNYVAEILSSENINSEIVWLGDKPLQDCVGCNACIKLGKCIFEDDIVNELIEKSKLASGFIFGTPVYYASPSGRLISALNRLFYAGSKHLSYKPAAAIAVARRAGGTASIDVLNKYFSINNMPIICSLYWNILYGRTPEEIEQDNEGIQTLKVLATNMSWILKSIDFAHCNGVNNPRPEPKQYTNFIR